jgi:uncharacterized protein with ParB-like and HNH nuclease domain
MAIQTKTIGELKDYKFYVPSYQRGYRWTEQEVTALLNDVNDFHTETGERYCIQPLLVKAKEDGSFEVVDGQQRLTTIYIFMKIAEEKTEYIPFYIEYETRNKSREFLSNLSAKGEIDDSNIDYFHITTTRKAINAWLDSQKNRYIAINRIFEKLLESVFFIWHEMSKEVDPINMFTKINLGKISLTNSELIKALLMNKDNYELESNDDIHKRQTEMSIAWDRIEQGLRNDSLWFFLNENEYSGTRIDLLFELLADERSSGLPIEISKKEKYYSFLVFSNLLSMQTEKEKFVKEVWDDIEKLYAEFYDWYSNLNKFHIIGYLIASNVTIGEIFDLTRGKRKSAVTKALLEKAKNITGNYTDLANLSYDSSNDKRKIRKFLLLFNIATLVCKSEKSYRFPFDIYKGETADKLKWDIEHIHATADNTDEADDNLGNLTLLDAVTNRSYKNAPFAEKRRIIIERQSKGLFVPLCTMNVFLKVYSKDISNMTVWEDKDKEDYINTITLTFDTFFQKAL